MSAVRLQLATACRRSHWLVRLFPWLGGAIHAQGMGTSEPDYTHQHETNAHIYIHPPALAKITPSLFPPASSAAKDEEEPTHQKGNTSLPPDALPVISSAHQRKSSERKMNSGLKGSQGTTAVGGRNSCFLLEACLAALAIWRRWCSSSRTSAARLHLRQWILFMHRSW